MSLKYGEQIFARGSNAHFIAVMKNAAKTCKERIILFYYKELIEDINGMNRFINGLLNEDRTSFFMEHKEIIQYKTMSIAEELEKIYMISIDSSPYEITSKHITFIWCEMNSLLTEIEEILEEEEIESKKEKLNRIKNELIDLKDAFYIEIHDNYHDIFVKIKCIKNDIKS